MTTVETVIGNYRTQANEALEYTKKALEEYWQNPTYPHKIAFRKGTVLYECDKYGKEIKSLAKK